MSAIVEQLQQALAEVKAKAAEEKIQVNAAVDALLSDVSDLKEQVIALQGQVNPDISEVLASITELGLNIEDIYVEPEEPEVPAEQLSKVYLGSRS